MTNEQDKSLEKQFKERLEDLESRINQERHDMNSALVRGMSGAYNVAGADRSKLGTDEAYKKFADSVDNQFVSYIAEDADPGHAQALQKYYGMDKIKQDVRNAGSDLNPGKIMEEASSNFSKQFAGLVTNDFMLKHGDLMKGILVQNGADRDIAEMVYQRQPRQVFQDTQASLQRDNVVDKYNR